LVKLSIALEMKEKYLQIFNYLLEFSKLRSKVVRDIENSPTNYTDILWLNSIPVNEKINCVIQNESDEGDYWLRIYKPEEPEEPRFPKIPKQLEEWIIPETLLNKEDLPKLFDEISGPNGDKIRLIDRKDIKEIFEAYCENNWFNDSEKYWKQKEIYDQEYSIYERVNDIYKEIFSIYNKSQQFGEEYELVMGVGLLNFKENDETPLICRHIITSKAEIEFEFSSKKSCLIVSQTLDVGLQIEMDAIIDLVDQFDLNDIIEAERQALDIIKSKDIFNPFDKEIHNVLQLIAERTKPGDGKYLSTSQKPIQIPKKETIVFAPALILRKRNTRSFTALYEKIVSDLQSIDDVSIPTLDDLIEIEKAGHLPNRILVDNKELNDADTIYFPNKYNDEQIAIIKKARFNNKVLVQGPPGTGKSHTIANLICHLLANGKKLLITAQTKRALEVLKDKLPSEFKPLTVNLLSGDSASIQDLESSVNIINDTLANTDIDILRAEIDKFSKDLLNLKTNRATDTNELLKIKEKASRKIEIGSLYNGTLTEIAEKIENDKPKFSWYKDQFADIANEKVGKDLTNYISEFYKYKDTDQESYSFEIPEISYLFDSNQISEIIQLYKKAEQEGISDGSNEIINSSNFDQIEPILNELMLLFENLDHNTFQYKDELIKDFLSTQKPHLISKIEQTTSTLQNLKKFDLKKIDRDIEIVYPPHKSLKVLKNDAVALLNFIKSGNSLPVSGLKFIKQVFLPKEIKEKLYFINSVSVNGSPCDTEAEFNMVLNDIQIKQDITELEQLWGKLTESILYSDTVSFYSKLQEDGSQLISILDSIRKQIRVLKSISDVNIKVFSLNSIKLLLKEVNVRKLRSKITEFEDNKSLIVRYLSESNIHPIAREILDSLNELNLETYSALLLKLNQIKLESDSFKLFKDRENHLEAIIPQLIGDIKNGTFDLENVDYLSNAIQFRFAEKEVKRLLCTQTEATLISRLKSYDSVEEKLISKIASKKAWITVLENLKTNRSLRQHLEAWVLAVKKIGKTGTGKRALKFRKVAQEEMAFCKTAVPCWIMPLYKVAETIQPEQGMYDYVIIDEASQLGPDAIFLLYISKNIIIVGDDKQTSPEYVGVDANTMVPYINKHLKNIPFKDHYGTEFSFFDHAKIFCDGVIVLREHFRCMPEIIEFSNKLFYAPEGKGLYPLKQYSENRLDPLAHLYCPNGVTEGGGQSIRNKNEAIAIVKQISDIVKDVRYKNKTIGVISLQGNTQSTLIENLLVKEIGEFEYKKRKIICGNSASFQGDERDLIFLSLVTAQNHNRRALNSPEDERRFNVAVSRAIEQIWLAHSVLPEDLGNSNDLRFKILDHFLNHKPKSLPLSQTIKRTAGTPPVPFDSWFEVDIFNEIIARGYSVQPQYEVARGKYRIDLVVFVPDGTKIAIECDGDRWHGPEKYQDDMLRQKVLERCGWQFYRIRGSEYYLNREKALESLWSLIGKKQSNPPITIFENKEESRAKDPIDNDSVELKQKLTIGLNKEGLITSIPSEIVTCEDRDKENKVVQWESETCYWSSIEQPGYRFASSKNAWYKKKELYDFKDKAVVRFLNLFENGNYVLTEEKPLNADFVLPIRRNQMKGYLLQFYACGHVNKVNVSTLLSRKIGKEYMNGLNSQSTLNSIQIIEKEEILAIYYTDDGVKKFKAHLTENIPSRDLLHLQGYKVIGIIV